MLFNKIHATAVGSLLVSLLASAANAQTLSGQTTFYDPNGGKDGYI
jgi:hypothetical protein